MPIDLDTFLVALYTIVDDLYQQHAGPAKPVRPGPPPTGSDSEVLTLALCAQWWGRSERAFLRYVCQYWRGYFPRLLSQSAYNRRCRDLAGVLVALVPIVAQELHAATAAYEVIDTVAVPLARRCQGCRQRLFADEAAIGWGGTAGWPMPCWAGARPPMHALSSSRTCSAPRALMGRRMWARPGHVGRRREPGHRVPNPIWPIRASEARTGTPIGPKTTGRPSSPPRSLEEPRVPRPAASMGAGARLSRPSMATSPARPPLPGGTHPPRPPHPHCR